MKLELNRGELDKAITCYLRNQGIDVDNKVITSVVGRNTTIVNIEDKAVEFCSDEKPVDSESSNSFIGE